MTDQPVRTLILIRHAKAEESSDTGRDHDRPLSQRGRADAAAAGQWLKDQDLAPTAVLCSSALRTRETWAGVSEASGYGGLVEHDARIYNASIDQLVSVLRDTEADARVVALVGHAPGVPGLAATLADGAGEADAIAALEEGFPTGTLAVLDIVGDWSDVGPGSGRVRAVHTARAGAAS